MTGLRWETRQAWGARAPKNRRYDVGLRGVSIHYPGANAKFRDMTHAQHQKFMRDWQAMHMGRGSNDLEYGSVICPCGIWMEARTEQNRPQVRVGSNGNSDANYWYTSIQMMLGTGEEIRQREINWLGEAVAWLRTNGWGDEVVGHCDLSQTACPGNSIYASIPSIIAAADRHGSGQPEPEEPEPEEEEEEGEDMLIVRKPNGATFLIIGATRKHGIYEGSDLNKLREAGIPFADVSDKTFDSILSERH